MDQPVWLSVTIEGAAKRGEEAEAWRAANVVEELDGDMCVVTTCDGGDAAKATVPRAELLLREVLPLGGMADLVHLGNLHGPAILENLALRFGMQEEAQAIYTYCGQICIAVLFLPAVQKSTRVHLPLASTRSCYCCCC